MSTIDSVRTLRAPMVETDHGASTGPTVYWWELTCLPPWPARVTAWQLPLLDDLGDHILKDIGLTRAEIAFEASKLLWQC
jgi:Domain of unknown function (DUF1127)